VRYLLRPKREREEWLLPPALLGCEEQAMPTVFLDRDGVINENRDDYVKSWDEFRFLPGSLEALGLFTRAGFRIFIVTNQACVNRGLASPAAIEEIHRNLVSAAARDGGRIEAIHHCPHRPEEHCRCRKPEPGMLVELARTHRVDLQRAYMVGDAATDVAAGQRAGCRTVLVRTGRGASQQALLDGAARRPTIIVDDLLGAARRLCAAHSTAERWGRVAARLAPSPQEHTRPC
jgi:D-glycero-D-manno-heptose 1,7-bisphosphate phosphatase